MIFGKRLFGFKLIEDSTKVLTAVTSRLLIIIIMTSTCRSLVSMDYIYMASRAIYTIALAQWLMSICVDYLLIDHPLICCRPDDDEPPPVKNLFDTGMRRSLSTASGGAVTISATLP